MEEYPKVHLLFHRATSTCCYVVSDNTGHCAIIDSALDYDPASGTITNKHVLEVAAYVDRMKLSVDWIIETHIHADHLTASVELKRLYPHAKTAIGEHVKLVQKTFKAVYNDEKFDANGTQFDHLWKDGEEFFIGSLACRVLFTPGHTPSCTSLVIGDSVFTGDTLFLPEYGTARCDFPSGSASQLYHSIQRILQLPDDTKQYVGHIYGDDAEPSTFRYMSTIGQQKASNKHIKTGTTEEQFVAIREERDRTLDAPKLLLPSLQVNMRAGHLPPPENNGVSYLKIPTTIKFN